MTVLRPPSGVTEFLGGANVKESNRGLLQFSNYRVTDNLCSKYFNKIKREIILKEA